MLMRMNRRTACRTISGTLAALCAGVRLPTFGADDRFAGFPEINKFRTGERTQAVIVSDGVSGVLRPKWTRAMTDLGGWPSLFRFKQDIYFAFYHGDGHRYQKFESTDKLKTYRSSDEGRTWKEIPSCPPNDPGKFQGNPEFVPAGDTLYCYDFDARRQTQVRTST